MQSPIIMAFRKRLKSRGYSDISIKLDKDINGNYIVSAKEPLCKQVVSKSCGLSFMYNFR